MRALLEVAVMAQVIEHSARELSSDGQPPYRTVMMFTMVAESRNAEGVYVLPHSRRDGERVEPLPRCSTDISSKR